jgi:hypothetical protein
VITAALPDKHERASCHHPMRTAAGVAEWIKRGCGTFFTLSNSIDTYLCLI